MAVDRGFALMGFVCGRAQRHWRAFHGMSVAAMNKFYLSHMSPISPDKALACALKLFTWFSKLL
jgi:hypothetical protein